MDGDGSTEAMQIVAFAKALAGGADYVKASRFLPGAGTDDMPIHRRVGNWLFVVAARVLFGARFTDITYGYNAVRREHRDSMALEIDGWAQEIVTNVRMVRLGRRVAEIPAFEPRRIAGVAKLGTWSAGWDILRAMIVERVRPLTGIVESQIETGVAGQRLVPVQVFLSGTPDPMLEAIGSWAANRQLDTATIDAGRDDNEPSTVGGVGALAGGQ
jgi:hypothetical protein